MKIDYYSIDYVRIHQIASSELAPATSRIAPSRMSAGGHFRVGRGYDDDDFVPIEYDDLSDFSAERLPPQLDGVLDQSRTWLCPTKYSGDGSEYEKHLSSHLHGTGTWVFETEAYRQWYDGHEHGILWIRGIPGAGKSVLASSIIRRLAQEEAPIVWFFFRHTIGANRSPEGLLRDWLAQVLHHSPVLQSQLLEYVLAPSYKRLAIEDLPIHDLWRLLRQALAHFPKVYCVVDALDEMAASKLEAFLSSIDLLGRWRPGNVKIVVTSRPLATVEKSLRGVKILDVRLDKSIVQGDICRYVRSRLDSSTLSLETRSEVEQAVNRRADGLFLYAKLALDFLLAPDADVMRYVAAMPADLGSMYTDLLMEHSASTGVPAELQELALLLVTHATRPLRLLEIAEALKTVYKPRDGLGAIKDVVRATCGPLLEILPDETVRVVHHSLTEYLKGTTPSPESRPFPIFEPGASNNRLALLCLSYLVNGGLDNVKIKRRREISGDVNYTEPASMVQNQILSAFTEYAGSQWPIHAQRAIAGGHDQVLVNGMLDSLLVDDNLDVMEVLA